MHKLYYLLVFIIFSSSLQAQTSQVIFGKNRVQHHRDFEEWMKYESDNFITYWYGEGRNIGQSVVQIAEYDFAYIQSILEHRINEKIQIIVYVDLTDLKQSNIGNDEAFTNTAGQTKIVGNKIFVYFNGDHNDLRRQIREGISSVYLEAMLFGSSIQEIVQNAVLLNLPLWFKEGMIAYMGEDWNTEKDDALRQIIASDQYEDFGEMSKDHPRLVGQAFWYYIAELYGTPTVSNLLYLTRINRSIESGFLYVLGTPYHITIEDWRKFFIQRYANDVQDRDLLKGHLIDISNKKELPLTQLKISPNGQHIIYVTNEIGRYKVYLQNVQTGEREIIFKLGFRNAIQATDYNYPLLDWNPSGQEIAILYEHRDIPQLMRYNLLEKSNITEELGTEYHRVYSMEYVNPSTLVLSATVRGFSDIFLYFPATRQSQRITTDFWDDLDAMPVKIRDRTGIIFASNRDGIKLKPRRLDSILPIGNFDLFYYDITNRPGELVRLTNTPLANERNPIGIDTTNFAYLTDKNGIYNREVAFLEDYIDHYDQRIELLDGTEIILNADSTMALLDTALIDTIYVYPVIKERSHIQSTTNLDRNILSQSIAARTGRLLNYTYDKQAGSYILSWQGSALDQMADSTPPTIFQIRKQLLFDASLSIEEEAAEAVDTMLEEWEDIPAIDSETPIVPADSIPVKSGQEELIDIDNYLFQSEFTEEENFSQDKNQAPITATPVDGSLEAAANKIVSTDEPSIPQKKVYRFRPGKITPYRTTFRTDFVTFNMDNNLLFEGLDSYAANPDGFNTQPMSLLLKGNFKDLFEDYVIEGGLRLPTNFNGTEYFLTINNRKHRLDRTFTAYRRNQRFVRDGPSFVPWRLENNIVMGQYGVRYPLDIFQSLRATATLLRDRVQYLATDQSALEVAPAPDRKQRIGLKLEYVFDNTLDLALNLRQGTRYKVYTEMFKQFSINLDPSFKFSLKEGFLGLVGFDARHYEKLDKRSIFAVRLAGTFSFGADKVLYYLGGTDNELFSGFNSSIPAPFEAPSFVTLANNMRGFDMNIRNGNSYVLANVEVRVPIIRYITEQIQSPFLYNLQLVGFFDGGTAWSGKDPYSEENPLNTSFFPEDVGPGDFVPVTAKVVYFREPLVFSYGVGARTLLFGYMVRVDYAWGIETRNILEPKWHISLGADF